MRGLSDDDLATCIADPGSVVGQKLPDETVSRWGVRAIRARAMETSKVDAAGDLIAEVQYLYDLQCPVRRPNFAAGDFGQGAHIAHVWWETCLGGALRRYKAATEGSTGGGA